MDNFTTGIEKSEEGIGDIDEYINEEEMDLHIHKRLLEMVPDILTSLGILEPSWVRSGGLRTLNQTITRQ